MLRKMTSSQQDKFYIVFLGILVLGLFTLCMSGCANTPSGAIEHRTPIFYLDGKFHEDIPEEYIFETWGYRIQDALGNEHTYNCLLYTSPSPRDRTRSRMPSSA